MKIQTTLSSAGRAGPCAAPQLTPAEAPALLEVGRCSSFFFFPFWHSTPQATFMGLFTSMGFQRSLSNPPLICQSSHPTSHMQQRQRHGSFQDIQIGIWQSFYSQNFFFVSSPPSFSSFIAPPILFAHIFRYNYEGSLQMFPLFLPTSRFVEMSNVTLILNCTSTGESLFFPLTETENSETVYSNRIQLWIYLLTTKAAAEWEQLEWLLELLLNTVGGQGLRNCKRHWEEDSYCLLFLSFLMQRDNASKTKNVNAIKGPSKLSSRTQGQPLDRMQLPRVDIKTLKPLTFSHC